VKTIDQGGFYVKKTEKEHREKKGKGDHTNPGLYEREIDMQKRAYLFGSCYHSRNAEKGVKLC